MGTLSITRKVASTAATAAAMNTNYDEIEAVINGAIEATNIAADAVTAAKINVDVVRANYGLVQHTDGSLYVDVSDTNPSLEISDGGLRAKVYGVINRSANGLTWGRSGDVIFSSSTSTPDGFTDVSATYADKCIRVSATALSTGGSDTLSGNTGSHVLTTDEIPAHTHTYYKSSNVAGSSPGSGETQSYTSESSGSAGGGSGHTHTLTSTACIPAYVTLKMYAVT